MSVTSWDTNPIKNAEKPVGNVLPTDLLPSRALGVVTRDLMAQVKRYADDQGGALVSSGENNVYVVTTNSGITLKPGVSISFWADRDNTAEPALDIDGSGPQRWRGADGLSLPAGSIQEGLLYTVVWNAALPNAPAEWRLQVGGGAGLTTTGITFDFSGAPADRGLYDAQPKGKTFLAIADTPVGPSWVLYIKRSNRFGDWSTGLPIKASPAQSTADAQAAADAATAQARTASAASDTATTQAGISSAQAGVAVQQAAAASASAADAAQYARLVGTLIYDMGSIDQPLDDTPTNPFDFGRI